MIEAVLLAVEDPATAARVTDIIEGAAVVVVPSELPVGDIVALATEACGRRPERMVLVADGERGGELLTAALNGWLPVVGIAVAPRFSAMPLRVRVEVPIAISPVDEDGRTLAARLAAADHPVTVVEGDVVDALEVLLSRGL